MKNSLPKNSNQPDNSLLRYSGLAFQMLAVIGVFIWLGYLADHYWRDGKPLFVILMAFVGTFASLYQFYKSISKSE